jgi:hypothetical protein
LLSNPRAMSTEQAYRIPRARACITMTWPDDDWIPQTRLPPQVDPRVCTMVECSRPEGLHYDYGRQARQTWKVYRTTTRDSGSRSATFRSAVTLKGI